MSAAGEPGGPLVLVTFCNAVASPETAFALVDLASGHARQLAFGYERSDYGATGMTGAPGGGLLVALPGSRRLLRLDGDLEVVASSTDRAFDDVHSVYVVGGSVYVAATGIDSVLELQLEGDGFRPVASHPLSRERRDTLHVNSVCALGDRILVSVFGLGWRDLPVGAPIGQIVELDSGQPVSTGLRHPHTLVARGGELYVLGSYAGAVEQVRPDGRRAVCALYPGYLRGLVFLPGGGAVAGVSGRRSRSRGLGTVNVAGAARRQPCGLVHFADDWTVEQFVDLSWLGREIFDLAVYAGPSPPPTPADSLAAAQHRCRQLENAWEAPAGGPVPPPPD